MLLMNGRLLHSVEADGFDTCAPGLFKHVGVFAEVRDLFHHKLAAIDRNTDLKCAEVGFIPDPKLRRK